MIKFKKKLGFPIDVDIDIKQLNEREYKRMIIVNNEIIQEYTGSFEEVTSLAKQYVNGIFKGYELSKGSNFKNKPV